jgi:hypothetical protein
MKYMVIASVDTKEYLVSIEASSLINAEHLILDLGICGRHEYGVEGATAFDAKGMKTDTFISWAMRAETISMEELARIVEARNARIRAQDEAENRIHEIEEQMKRLSEELEAARKVLAA